ncbi:hypothetical protein KKF91_13125 [Myxococcota bacterium]|nr:hypothetical protein [Myxococcota bacterium]MBU1431478.1 hypothetical protein [Myxococcota bacterium]MBU1897627.1 hypothetical protein [Myxococcota bacterium]
MRIAFVANTHGELERLEEALLQLLNYGVERIIPVELAVHDVEAVLRERAARFPEPVEPHDLRFPDFVLASVLRDQIEPDLDEVARTQRLRACLVTDGEAERGMRVEGQLIVVRSVQTPLEGAALLVLAPHERFNLNRDKIPPRLCPGHLRDAFEGGEAPGVALVDVTRERIEIRQLQLNGALSGPMVL